MFHSTKKLLVLLILALIMPIFLVSSNTERLGVELGSASYIKDPEHILVNNTYASGLFSAWGAPRIALPGAQVYAIEIGVIENAEELLVCDQRGDIGSLILRERKIIFQRPLLQLNMIQTGLRG